MSKINFSSMSSQELDNFVLNNFKNAEMMAAYSEFLSSSELSSKDAGLASSDESTVEGISQMVEVINPAPIVEPTLSDEKTNPLEPTLVVRKPKTFKAKEIVSLDRKFHTIQEVAACYRIGVSTLHKYLKDGLIKGFKMGNQWRFSQSQIDAFETRITSGGK